MVTHNVHKGNIIENYNTFVKESNKGSWISRENKILKLKQRVKITGWVDRSVIWHLMRTYNPLKLITKSSKWRFGAKM